MAIAALAKLGTKAAKAAMKARKVTTKNIGKGVKMTSSKKVGSGIRKLGDRNQRRIIAGGAAGAAVSTRKKPKAQTPTKLPKQKQLPVSRDKAKARPTVKKSNIVTDKKGNAVRTKDGKAVTFKGKDFNAGKTAGALRRSNKMGGGMMKKRMKRGGRAK